MQQTAAYAKAKNSYFARLIGTLVRINALWHDENAPDRAPASRKRKGLALSGSWQATDKLLMVADYYYLDADDKPDLGSWIVPNGGKPLKDIPVYLQQQDFLNSDISTVTWRLAGLLHVRS